MVMVLFLQADDDTDWSVLKPDIFGAIMDFFATDKPILNQEVQSTSSDADSGLCYQLATLCRLPFSILSVCFACIASLHHLTQIYQFGTVSERHLDL